MKGNVPKPKVKYSVERCIRNIGYMLARDFQTSLGDPSFCANLQGEILKGSAARVRDLVPVADDKADAYRFKCEHQMASLLKRFRFRKDLYSDNELKMKAINTFVETQGRIRSVDFDYLSPKTQEVMRLAGIFIAHVLGQYCDEEHRERSRFGKKASVGIPAIRACESARWEPEISGSSQQIAWFDSEMSQNPHVSEYWRQRLERDPNRSIYQETDVLAMTLVPKTFKSLRTIVPNTTIGTYHSYGLGEMIRKRLRNVGYDITTLQERHKFLACWASTSGLFVTADLSSASDSISRELLRRLLPDDWFQIMDSCRIGKIRLPDGFNTICEMETFCTMGIGYTFPLQTLVFLSLLKAIEAVHLGLYNRGLISVYGDDMIYTCEMHQHVLCHFEELGFVVNVDKTYCDGDFRESCGGDYYRGMDVRPFQPRNDQSSVGEKAYEATLYKYANGLLRRWTEYEVPETLDWICRELVGFTTIKVVPADFPDDSGIKVSLRAIPVFLERFAYAKPKHKGHGVFRFSYLRFRTNLREEERHEPYYWLQIRGQHDNHSFDCQQADRVGWLMDLIHVVTYQDRDLPSPLIVLKGKPEGKSKANGTRGVRSCITGRRARRDATYVGIQTTGSYQRHTGASRFEAPKT